MEITEASKAAAILGSMGRDKPKTMTKAAMRQRKLAAKRPRPTARKDYKAVEAIPA